MVVQRLDVLLVEGLDGHEQHVGVDGHSHPGRCLQQKVGLAEGFAQVGCHRDAALHDEWLVDNVFSRLLGYGERQGASPDADGEALFNC